MFYPQAMTEVELIIPEKDLLAVTNVLGRQGVFHQVDASYLSSEAGHVSADSWQEKATAYAALERQIRTTMQALSIDESQSVTSDQAVMVRLDVVRPLVGRLEHDVQQAINQLADEKKKLEQLETYLQQLEPLAGLDIDIHALSHPHYMFFMLGIIPTTHLQRLQTSLARVPFVLLILRQDNQNAVVWLAGTQRNADILDRAARSAYLNPLDLPDVHQGTPSEIIESLATSIQRVRQRIAEQQAAISALHEARKQRLQILLWRVRISRLLAQAAAHFGKLRYTYLIVGWVPSARLAGLMQQLKRVSADILIEANPSKRANNKQNVPITLHDSGLLGVFQQLVTMYAQPRYDEIDPTFLIALMFPILFGAMFGDVGHGLILALLGRLITTRRVKALRSLSNLGPIISACGIAAILFGFLYGSIFGLEDVLPALWTQPMHNIMQVLTIAIGGGVVLLSLGFLMNILNAWVARDWGRLLVDQHGIAGLALYWSLVALVVGAFSGGLPVNPTVFVISAVVAGLAVMFSEALKQLIEDRRPIIAGSIGMYTIQGFFELFEAFISFLSNSLSYVRVGAFAVAHGGLSAMIFILADLTGPSRGVAYWIVIILGNLFIVGFEGLIVGIQTMRLEYYEFFSKFFTGGGMPYRPMTLLPTAKE